MLKSFTINQRVNISGDCKQPYVCPVTVCLSVCHDVCMKAVSDFSETWGLY